MPRCVYGKVADECIDIFDREAVFPDNFLDPIRRRHPRLKFVLKQVTTNEGVEFVSGGGRGFAATISVHQLAFNRNTMLSGSMRPHYYCLPVAKWEWHRVALLAAAKSGDRKYFLGAESAPHLQPPKEAPLACAGFFFVDLRNLVPRTNL